MVELPIYVYIFSSPGDERAIRSDLLGPSTFICARCVPRLVEHPHDAGTRGGSVRCTSLVLLLAEAAVTSSSLERTMPSGGTDVGGRPRALIAGGRSSTRASEGEECGRRFWWCPEARTKKVVR